MRVKTESEVTYKVRCLKCKRGTWIIDEYHANRFVESGDTFRWSCHTCGHEYTFKVNSLDDVEIETTGIIHTPVWDVLYIDGTNPPIYAVHGTIEVVPYEDDEDRYNRKRYYYEEHICPTNILEVDALVSMSVSERDGTYMDADPHGILRYVGTIVRKNIKDYLDSDSSEDQTLIVIEEALDQFKDLHGLDFHQKENEEG